MKETMTAHEFSLRITYLMKRMGWDRKAMAENLGVTTSNLYYWLKGVSTPRLPTVKKLVDLYKLHNITYIEDQAVEVPSKNTTPTTPTTLPSAWVLVKVQNVDLSLKPSMPGVYELYVSEPRVRENDLVYVSDTRGLRVMQVVEIANDALGVIKMITNIEGLTMADIRNIDVCRKSLN